jgi:hypothetical protein
MIETGSISEKQRGKQIWKEGHRKVSRYYANWLCSIPVNQKKIKFVFREKERKEKRVKTTDRKHKGSL